MSWLDSDYPYRVAVTVEGSTATSGANDVDAIIPASWDFFWDLIDTSGFGIRVAHLDGRTAPTSYQWSGFSKANKTGTLQVEDFQLGVSNTTGLFWLYFGIESGSETDGSGTFTPTTPLDGFVELSEAGIRQVTFAPERPGAEKPLTEFSKNSADDIFVWVEITEELAKAREVSQEAKDFGEVLVTDFTVKTGGTPQASMIDLTLHRVVYTQDSRTWVRTFVQAGSDGTDYVAELWFLWHTGHTDGAGAIITAESNQRFLVKVRDPTE